MGSFNFKIGFDTPIWRASAYGLLCLLTCACTNNLFSGFGGRQSLSTNSGFGPGQNFLSLSTVVESNAVPGTVEFIGDGSGKIGEFCLSANQQAPTNEGASTCECQFDYVNNGNPEQVRIETDYHEENLIRCANAVPSGITNVEASIFLTTAGVNSNKIRTTLPDLGNLLDLTDPRSYDKIENLQCRDIVFIPQLFAALFYDPIQSESPLISYSLNHFTNSIARSVLALYNNSASGQGAQIFSKFECATDPNKRPFWYNSYIYSLDPDGASSQTIFPPAGSTFDRSTFYLAKKSSGEYDVPVNALFSPLTVAGTGTFEPIGYGAKPSGTNEVCPSVDLPAGWEQVKVYAFRAALQARDFVQSISTNSRKNVEGIFCNPGQFPSGIGAIQDCRETGQGPPTPQNPPEALGNEYFQSSKPPNALAARVFAVQSTGSGPAANDVCFERIGEVANSSRTEPVNPITDIWQRRWDQAGAINQEVLANPPFNLTTFGVTEPNGPGDVDVGYVPAGDLTTGNLDNNTNRAEQYLVVTPVNINSNLLNPPNGVGRLYAPFRYRSQTECNSPNPNGCPAATRIPYLYNDKDLATGEEGAFPICAVRPVSQ